LIIDLIEEGLHVASSDDDDDNDDSSDDLLDWFRGATEKVHALSFQLLAVADQRAEQFGLFELPRLVEEEELGRSGHVLHESIELLLAVDQTLIRSL